MTLARLNRLRQLLWLYFWLLIFEGALRRWFLPAFSDPLLLIRDPIALLALFWAWPLLYRRPWRAWLIPLLFIGPISLILAITVGHGDILTALYGSRVLLLQLPLIFVFATVFNRDDVIRIAWISLFISIPMTVLLVAQSSVPPAHILNVGAGGVGSAVFDGAAGRFRPPGTFSFINGVSLFYSLALASLFSVLYANPIGQKQRIFCAVAATFLVVAVPVSISRSLLAGYIQVAASLILSLLISRTKILPVVYGFLALFLAFSVATTTPAFQQTVDAFAIRWEQAAASESEDNSSALASSAGIFEQRILNGLLTPLSNLENIPILGFGIGLGSNVGSQRLAGVTTFLLGEGSWESSLSELGLPIGLVFLIWRLSLAFWILRRALRSAFQKERLPLIFVGATFLILITGQTSQPTGLGFLVLLAGLSLASFNPSSRLQASISYQVPKRKTNSFNPFKSL